MTKIYNQQKKFQESKFIKKRREPNHPVVKAFAQPKVNFLKKYTSLSNDFTLLDVGCGNGYFTHYLAKLYDVTGLDFSKEMLNQNSHHKLVQGDAENLPFKNSSFDIVFCSNLLHHLADPKIAIKEMIRVSNKYIILSEPNRNNPLMYLFGLLKKEENGLLKINKKYLNRICIDQNLEPIKILTSGFIFPNKTPNFPLLIFILKLFDLNSFLGSYITVIYKKINL